ncbi:MAG: hypothetical protein CVU97_04100 [Firmicutes bacterium HGW-Firmicutes-21]|nr:MAG: hypothetical protein CVU97_04100 [Firmicutes bacterium HGW-Firmicutes-21]
MNENDDLYTIEINHGDYPPRAGNISAVKANESEANGTPPKSKEFMLFESRTNQTREEKHKEFLRLRDNIFNKNRGPVNNNFLQQAIFYADKAAEPAQHIPFSCYWPTYDVMSDAQLKWYFYWREQVRNNEYPQTALSYIFIYIYELINEVGTKNSEDGFVKLCTIWNEYRAAYQNLDRYMSAWINDYFVIHFPNGLTESVLAEIAGKEIFALLPESIVTENAFSTDKTHFSEQGIIQCLSKYSNYKMLSSRFYQGENKVLLDFYMAEVFCFLDLYMKKKTNKGVFETNKTKKTQKRMPYQNAIYQGKVRSVEINVDDYTKNKELRSFITAVIKYTENVVRGLTGYSGKLKHNLPTEYCKLIEKYIIKKRNAELLEKRTHIEMDKTKIKQLIVHSDIVRDMLLTESGSDLQEEKAVDTSALVQEPDITITDEINYEGMFADLFVKLTDIQKQILTFIIGKESAVCLKDVSDAFNGAFIQMEIDNINEAAIDCYGDILILADGEWLLLQEL